jgi:hypothetical protein
VTGNINRVERRTATIFGDVFYDLQRLQSVIFMSGLLPGPTLLPFS